MTKQGFTDYAEIQQEEMDVLKAIYMDDFQAEEIKAIAWNRKADCQFRLKLWPSSGRQGSDIFIDLIVTLPTTYPKTLPRLSVMCGNMVPPKTATKILSATQQKAKDLLGEVMIHEIALATQDLLDEAVEVMAETDKIPALDEQRMRHEAEILQAAKAADLAKRREEELASEQRDLILSVQIERELAIQARSKLSKSEAVPFLGGSISEADRLMQSSVSFDQGMTFRMPGDGGLIAFKSVTDIDFYRAGTVTDVYTARPLTGEGHRSKTSRSLVMKTCELGSGWSEEDIKTEISTRLELSLQSAEKIPRHRNLLPVLGYRIQSAFSADNSRTWGVRILTEYLPRGSLADTVEVINHVEPNMFRTLFIQVLEGLQHLHAQNIPHGRLKLSNVLVERNKNGEFALKLSDYLYQAELDNLTRPHGASRQPDSEKIWLAPEHSKTTIQKPDATADMWQLGIVAAQLLFGINVMSRFNSPNALMQGLSITPSLEQMFLKMFHDKPGKRLSCFDLLASAFLRSDEPMLDVRNSPTLSRMPSNTNAYFSKLTRTRRSSAQTPGMGTSRYIQDFSEHSRLGRGGFGQVVRARNKIDGQWYAVKKITSESSNEVQSVLSEVMLLSRLSHPHIVRYVTAWLEEAVENDISNLEESDIKSDDSANESIGSALVDSGNRSISQQFESSRGLDFIGSGAYIQFGGDSDEENDVAPQDDGEDDDDSSQFQDGSDSEGREALYTSLPSDIIRRRGSSQAPPRTILYIQMEYCENQTLRDLIKDDLAAQSDEYWRILRQITGALEHVHSQGIIHRDLKPENIFITQGRTNARLGDFGLAKPQVRNRQKGASGVAIGTLTASIGTSVYIAPEVRSSGGGTYDEKADMYSLGIILFEMCYTLRATAMERAQIMDDLRKIVPFLPRDFEATEKWLEKELIVGLLTHTPQMRLSALALLERIPVDADDDALRHLIENVSRDRNNPMHRKLISRMFENSSRDLDAQAYTYDFDLAQETCVPGVAYLHDTIRDRIISIFQTHGAVEDVNRQVLLPANEIYPDAVKVMAVDGNILQLPFDLVLSKARRLAKQRLVVSFKSFTFSSVYRNSSAGHPRSFEVVNFDIISRSSVRLALQEAEVLKVVEEIIEAIPALSVKTMRFVVNHSIILNAILRKCKVPESKHGPVKAHLSKLAGAQTATNIRSDLRGPDVSISLTAIDDLLRFNTSHLLEEGIPRLRNLLSKTEVLESAFSHLEAFAKYALGFGIQHKIYLNPLSCLNADFYEDNLMFQCVFEKKKRAVFCAGGRYDKLIRDSALSRSSQQCHSVGFSLSLSGIMRAMDMYNSSSQRSVSRRQETAEDSILSTRRCDVLVDGPEESVLSTGGLSILAELWANNIRAELNDHGKSIPNIGHGEQTDHELVLIVKADGSLRLRGQLRRDDIEVRRVDLIAILRSELRERERLLHIRQPERLRSRHEVNESQTRDVEVSVLWSSSRSKKSNRQMIVDEALSRTASDIAQHLEVPIIAVELKDDLFESLKQTNLYDPESWRKSIQYADPGTRKYLAEIQELLNEKSTETKLLKNIYLYNFRSKACICYNLAKSN